MERELEEFAAGVDDGNDMDMVLSHDVKDAVGTFGNVADVDGLGRSIGSARVRILRELA